MTKTEFIRQENQAFRSFQDRYVIEDFQSASPASYFRSYRCECGFSCSQPQEIWDHVCATPKQ